MEFTNKLDGSKDSSVVDNNSMINDLNSESKDIQSSKNNLNISSENVNTSTRHQNDEDIDMLKSLTLDESKDAMTKASSKADKNKNSMEFKDFIEVLLKIEKRKGLF